MTETNEHGTIPPVTLYWRPGCVFCAVLRRQLAKTGLPLVEVNIWDDPGAAAVVRSVAGGNETVPTVVIGEHALVNPTPRQVLDTVRTVAPEADLPARPPGRAARLLSRLRGGS